LINVDRTGHSGSWSGRTSIIIPAIIATPETAIGNAFGPKGSEKNGNSNCVALAKKASATQIVSKPVIRSDIIS
jgi:hypothetical protein